MSSVSSMSIAPMSGVEGSSNYVGTVHACKCLWDMREVDSEHLSTADGRAGRGGTGGASSSGSSTLPGNSHFCSASFHTASLEALWAAALPAKSPKMPRFFCWDSLKS
jgi:hypothetical protein